MFLAIPLAIIALAAFLFIAKHNVRKQPSAEDRVYAQKILAAAGVAELKTAAQCRSLDDELAVFKAVQLAVLKASPKSIGIPKGRPREPRDLFEHGHGLCYDRSRSIEKILAILGFDNRHAALFAVPGGPLVREIFVEGIPSHHVTEVVSRGGRVVLDSNTPWLGITCDNECIGLSRLSRIGIDARRTESADPVLSMNFVYVWGLYARHGEFYPPYNRIPDINWADFLRGFSDLARQLWSMNSRASLAVGR